MNENIEEYDKMANAMNDLVKHQPGFLGMDSARNDTGITVSYWQSLDDIRNWKQQTEHEEAQKLGKSIWYKNYTVRVCKIERAYSFGDF